MDNLVYLIDDDAAVRESLAFLLSAMGWRVAPYDSVAAFTDEHREEPSLTGCLLLDMRMPGKGGWHGWRRGSGPGRCCRRS